jgi:hypothetical protein
MIPAIIIGIAGLTGLAWLYFQLRARSVDRWLTTYLRQAPFKAARVSARPGRPVHLLLCVADHFEPELGNAPRHVRDARVDLWLRTYPHLFGGIRDSDGRPPRHTFFYPLEAYELAYLDALARLCCQGFGEVEVHLHHDGECAAGLRERLLAYKNLLAERHQLLSRDRETGEVAYGFVHGDWALDNSGPDGRRCGVNNELEVLRETGCYADFTMPSAPDSTQTRKINSIYYAWGDPQRPKGHDWGIDVGAQRIGNLLEAAVKRNGMKKIEAGPEEACRPLSQALLLIQGPLLLDWARRKWGFLPRLENGCLQGNQPPTIERLQLWLRARVQVPSRPDWFFVKLHTHGCNEFNQAVVLGEPMVRFHEALAERARRDRDFHYHYVTAREMFNLVKAAEAGWTGSVGDALDYQLLWNGSTAFPGGGRKPSEVASCEKPVAAEMAEKLASEPGSLQPSAC